MVDQTILPAKRLALLLAAPRAGDVAVENDLMAMHTALRRKGLAPHEMITLAGPLSPSLGLAALGDVRNRIAAWRNGHLLVFFSGHGAYLPPNAVDAEQARPALDLTGTASDPNRGRLEWQVVFDALALPPTVHLVLLPDC